MWDHTHAGLTMVLLCPKDGTFKVWDVEERRLLHTEVCAVAEGEEEDVKVLHDDVRSHLFTYAPAHTLMCYVY